MSASIQNEARSLTLARGGQWYGTYGMAPCPICQPEGRVDQRGLKIEERQTRLLLRCFKSECEFAHILAALGIKPVTLTPPDPAFVAKREVDQRSAAEKHAVIAKRIWDASVPIHGTVAEAYLRGRGITCDLPDTLRFNPRCWHKETRSFLPAMVGRVDGIDLFAVHRTYLRPDGSGKAEVEPKKAMLGSVKGGALRLTTCDGPLVVAEGIENALSLACGLMEGPGAIWAALSTSGMRALRLPDAPGQLIIAPDGEHAGEEAAKALEKRAAAAGWCVEFFRPPAGLDWNDVLLREESRRGGP